MPETKQSFDSKHMASHQPSATAVINYPAWRYFYALAIDYDGTLTEGGRPNQELLDALQQQREGGRVVLLVTGRILAELRHDFFDVEDWFDLIVAENGAVIRSGNVSRTLAAPVPHELDGVLQRRGMPFRRGQALLAFDGEYDSIVFEELRHLELDSQIIHNRGSSMLLPAGVTKGSGLEEALHVLGVSAHNCIAIGDSENDLAMFEPCELGVAVSNAIESLKTHADLVLDAPSAEGVFNFLRSPIMRDESRVPTSRWRVQLGLSPEQQAVTLPASQINVLITGGARGGKSYAAGLLAEQLIEMKYSLCILDPEGDYVSLGLLRDVTVVGGEHGLPSVSQLAHTLRHISNSLVIDMSHLALNEQADYSALALQVFRAERKRSGMPHWVFADEAHIAFADNPDQPCLSSEKGYCLITYQPGRVCQQAAVNFDYVLLVASDAETEFCGIDCISALTNTAPAALKKFLDNAVRGQALLLPLSQPPELHPLIIDQRTIQHVRHRHKYANAALPPWRSFHFRTGWALTGAVATDFEEFHAELLRCDNAVLLHHARHADFSRWIEEVISDTELAAAVREIERDLAAADSDAALQAARLKLLDAVSKRYLNAATLVNNPPPGSPRGLVNL